MGTSLIPTYGLGIDWETSGYSYPNFASKHQGISFGAVIFDVKTFEIKDSLYREIKFKADKYEWNTGAENVHGLSRAHLEEHGIEQEDAAVELATLVHKFIGNTDIILLGHRVYFDRDFTNQLMASVDMEFNYHPTVIDTLSFGTVFLEKTKSDEVFSTLGLPPRGLHNALEDILFTIESVRKLKNGFSLDKAINS
jgi:oligoribonuclease (3'-5' exoribonuclease)